MKRFEEVVQVYLDSRGVTKFYDLIEGENPFGFKGTRGTRANRFLRVMKDARDNKCMARFNEAQAKCVYATLMKVYHLDFARFLRRCGDVMGVDDGIKQWHLATLKRARSCERVTVELYD
jgi:hypothetical protein